jgi:microcystin-dependent protein
MNRWLLALAALFLAGPALADRDGSGNYTVPNTFTSGTTITAAGHNQNWADIGTEMTNSLPRDGQAAMTGQLKAATGTEAAPGLSFSADTNTGFLPSGSDEIDIIIGGVSVGQFDSGGFDGSISGVPPAGSILAYGGTSEPSGYLFCYGQAVSRATYADLFAAIGTAHGVGDGSTTFNLPDLRGRTIAGQDDMGGSSANRLTGLTNGVNGDTFAAAGGLESFTLATTNLAAHTHSNGSFAVATTITNGSDVVRTDDFMTTGGQGGTNRDAIADESGDTDTLSLADGDVTGTSSSTGSTTALGHIQPTLVLNYIIKI